MLLHCICIHSLYVLYRMLQMKRPKTLDTSVSYLFISGCSWHVEGAVYMVFVCKVASKSESFRRVHEVKKTLKVIFSVQSVLAFRVLTRNHVLDVAQCSLNHSSPQYSLPVNSCRGRSACQRTTLIVLLSNRRRCGHLEMSHGT